MVANSWSIIQESEVPYLLLYCNLVSSIVGELALSQHDFLKVDAVYLSAPFRSHGGSLDTQNEIGIPLQLTPGALLSPAEHCPAEMASLVFFPGINSPGA